MLHWHRRRGRPRGGRARERGHDERGEIKGDVFCVYLVLLRVVQCFVSAKEEEGGARRERKGEKRRKRNKRVAPPSSPSSPLLLSTLPLPLVARNALAALGAAGAALAAVLPLVEHPLSRQQRARGTELTALLLLAAEEEAKRHGRIAVRRRSSSSLSTSPSDRKKKMRVSRQRSALFFSSSSSLSAGDASLSRSLSTHNARGTSCERVAYTQRESLYLARLLPPSFFHRPALNRSIEQMAFGGSGTGFSFGAGAGFFLFFLLNDPGSFVSVMLCSTC